MSDHRRSTFRLTLPLALIGIIVIILIAGTAVALALPIVSVTSEKSIAEMLPAGTPLYISADLNPTGSTKDNLDRIEHAYTNQPGWATISKAFNGAVRGTPSRSNCANQAQSQIRNHLGDLGHRSAFALISNKGLILSTSADPVTAFKRDAVFLASLDIHETLIQAIQGFHLSLQQTTSTYRGVTIYQETIPSCGRTSTSMPDMVYAALYKGYVVLGLLPDPVKAIIDVGMDNKPTLATVTAYQALQAQLPADQLGGWYLSGQALKQFGAIKSLKALIPTNSSLPKSYVNGVLHPTAGAVSVEPDGFRLTAEAYSPSATPQAKAAGQLATQLPSDTLGLLSIQGIASTVRNLDAQLNKQKSIPSGQRKQANRVLRDILPDLAGEADLVLLTPPGKMSFTGSNGTVNVPLSLFWQVSNEASASAHLHDLLNLAKLSNQLSEKTAPDGTTFYTTKQGYGYAVRKSWAIISLDILPAIEGLSPSQTLSSIPAYQKATLSGATPSSVWYVDLHGLRGQLESSILPTATVSERQDYTEYGKPWLDPLQSFSGSAGMSTDGKLGVTALFLGIGNQ